VAGDHRARTWLGASAITLGVGAALAAGSPVAHADGTTPHRPTGSSAATASAPTKPTSQHSKSRTASSARLLHATHTLSVPSGAGAPSAGFTKPRVKTQSQTTSTPASVVLPAAGTPTAPKLPTDPVAGLLIEVFSALNTLISPNPAVPPQNPLQLLAFEVVRRIEVELRLPVVGTATSTAPDPVIGTNPVSTSAGPPSPDDVVDTPYGAIGKWLLQSNGQVANFGGQRFNGKALVEPINVIILDPTSTTAQQSTKKLYADLSSAGFPAQLAHTTGFQGTIGSETFGQQPTGVLEGFSDNFFLLPDDHARAFGPALDAGGAGYVWTVAASREQAGLDGLLPTHVYVSFNQARDELARQLILNGATLVGIVALGNAYDTGTKITGDHDGYAIVIQLNN
jgi:hypothetical protein